MFQNEKLTTIPGTSQSFIKTEPNHATFGQPGIFLQTH
jgi:hypothetical protein